MATITGTLYDCGLGNLVGKAPTLKFTLSNPATSSAGLFVTEPISVTPNASGAFSMTLEATATMNQNRYYNLSVTWLDSAAAFNRVDFPDWRIVIPIVGGTLSDIIANYTNDSGGWNPLMVFWQTTEPNPWPIGSVWVDTSIDTPTSGDIRRRKA
jgi:hypothetical protein